LPSTASHAEVRYLTDGHVETNAAARRFGRQTPPDAVIATQGHALRVDGLLATLAVEAAIHHLDMIVELDRFVPPRTLTSSAGS
jgi:hypothetical protein